MRLSKKLMTTAREIYNLLLNADDETNARWGNELNNWKWPTDFPQISKWDELNPVQQMDISRPITKYIEWQIGRKKMLEWHHLNNIKHTQDEFSLWWQSRSAEGFVKQVERELQKVEVQKT